MPIFGAITIDENEEEYRFVKSSPVEKEGIYYTMFVFAPSSGNVTGNNNICVYGDSRMEKEISKLKRGSGTPFLELSGEITYKNTYGYLNAE